MQGSKLMALWCGALLAASACAQTHSPSVGSATSAQRECNGAIDNGKCIELRDGRIFVDGKEQLPPPTNPALKLQLPPPPAGVARLPLVYDRKALAHFVIDQQKELVLPQFYLVDLKTGRAAVIGDLAEPLAAFVSAHAKPADYALHSHSSATLLESLIAVSRHADGTPLQRDELEGEGKRYVAFQLWASWCPDCVKEAQALSTLLRDHPMPELAWIALETDPEALIDTSEVAGAGR